MSSLEKYSKDSISHQYRRFEFLVVLFGPANALSAFMSIVNNIFHDYSDLFIIAYLNDILIQSDIWKDHLNHSELSFNILCKRNSMLSYQNVSSVRKRLNIQVSLSKHEISL